LAGVRGFHTPGPPWSISEKSKSEVVLRAGLRRGWSLVRKEATQAGEAVAPEVAECGAAQGQMIGPVMGVGVLSPTVGVIGAGVEKIEVDAVHGFRPGLGMSF
jgi:hypothetical protein